VLRRIVGLYPVCILCVLGIPVLDFYWFARCMSGYMCYKRVRKFHFCCVPACGIVVLVS
jgi:hypothetical protein